MVYKGAAVTDEKKVVAIKQVAKKTLGVQGLRSLKSEIKVLSS